MKITRRFKSEDELGQYIAQLEDGAFTIDRWFISGNYHFLIGEDLPVPDLGAYVNQRVRVLKSEDAVADFLNNTDLTGVQWQVKNKGKYFVFGAITGIIPPV